MHEIRRVTPFLSVVGLLLLLTYCAGGCLAAATAPNQRCTFDEMMRKSGPLPTAVVREVPRKGQGAMQAYTVATRARENKEWELLRIVVSMEDLKDPNRYCSVGLELRPNYEGENEPCFEQSLLTEDRKTTIMNKAVPEAVILHTERLLIHRINGIWKMPVFGPDSNCQYFTVPNKHREQGFSAVDTVLYVAAGSGLKTWAVPCAVDPVGRSLAIALQVCAADVDILLSGVRRIAHALAHGLGFNLEEIVRQSLLISVPALRGSTNPALVVNSPLVLEKTKQHYNCGELKGMELQMNDDGTATSHWSRRNAKDSLMSPYDLYSGNAYTALTMALFEDLGYYKAVAGMEEPMTWGKDAGCGFLKKACTDESPREYPNMFCNTDDDTTLRCSSNRQAVGQCNQNVGNVAAKPPEVCPVVGAMRGGGGGGDRYSYVTCTTKGSNKIPGSLAVGQSWCLDGESLEAKAAEGDKWQAGVTGICAEVKCDNRNVYVKYLGNERWNQCPEGGSITPQSEYFKANGKIFCPKYNEVCTIAANGSSLLPEVIPDKGPSEDGNVAAPVCITALILLALIVAGLLPF